MAKRWSDFEAMGYNELIGEVLRSKKNKYSRGDLEAWGERELMELLMKN